MDILRHSQQLDSDAQSQSLRKYGARGVVDFSAAVVAATVVSPVMTIIDRAVIEAAAGKASVMESAKSSLKQLFKHPATFMGSRSFGSMMALYVGTYLTANVADTLCEQRDGTDVGTVSSDTTKLSAVVGVNVCLSMYKDSVFARAAGGVGAGRFPARSYVPFLVRDTITLYATFCLPAQLTGGSHGDASASAETAALLLCPAASQFLATPLHLLGLDLYNRRLVQPKSRLTLISRMWWSSSVMRACRVLPAFGLGGVVNTTVRQGLLARI